MMGGLKCSVGGSAEGLGEENWGGTGVVQESCSLNWRESGSG